MGGDPAQQVDGLPGKLTRVQRETLAEVQRRGGVFHSLGGDDPGGHWYYVTGSGRPDPRAVAKLISKGWLCPLGDGLLPGESQTFVPKHDA